MKLASITKKLIANKLATPANTTWRLSSIGIKKVLMAL